MLRPVFFFCDKVGANNVKVEGGMSMEEKANAYEIPKKEGSVWPNDICPAYTPRQDAIPSIKGCWYCRYADFHLKEERVLEVGICKWPEKILK